MSSNKYLESQANTFTKWINHHLEKKGLKIPDTLFTAFEDGTLLWELLTIISGKQITKIVNKPKIRVQKINNIGICLDFLKQEGIRLENIGPGDVADGTHNLVMGLVWTLILRYQIAAHNPSGGSIDIIQAKEEIIHWWKDALTETPEVSIDNLVVSFKTGLPFAALIYVNNKDKASYDRRLKMEPIKRVEDCIKCLREEFDVPALIEAEDVIADRPDEKALMTYSALIRQSVDKKKKDGEIKPTKVEEPPAEVNDLRTKFATAEAEKENFRTSNLELTRVLSEERETLSELKFKVEKWRLKYEEAVSTEDQLQKNLSKVETELKQEKEEKGNFEKELKQLKEKLLNEEKAIKYFEIETENAKKALQEELIAISRNLDDTKSRESLEIQKSQQEIKRLNDEVQKLQESNKKLAEDFIQCRNDESEEKKRNQVISELLSEAQNKVTDLLKEKEEKHILHSRELDDLKKLMEKFKEKVKELQESNKGLSNELAKYKKDETEEKRKYQTTSELLVEAQDKISRIDKEHEIKEASLLKEIEDLKGESGKLREEIKELQHSNKKLVDSFSEDKHKYLAVSNETQDKISKLESLNEAKALEIENLSKDFAKLKMEAQQFEESNKTLSNSLNESKAIEAEEKQKHQTTLELLKEANNSISKLQKEQQLSQSENEQKLKEEIEKIKEENAKIVAFLAEEENKHQTELKLLSEDQNKIKEMEQSQEIYREQIERMKDELKRIKKENENLIEERKNLQTDAGESSLRIKELELKQAENKKESEELKAGLTKLRETLGKFEETNRQLSSDLADRITEVIEEEKNHQATIESLREAKGNNNRLLETQKQNEISHKEEIEKLNNEITQLVQKLKQYEDLAQQYEKLESVLQQLVETKETISNLQKEREQEQKSHLNEIQSLKGESEEQRKLIEQLEKAEEENTKFAKEQEIQKSSHLKEIGKLTEELRIAQQKLYKEGESIKEREESDSSDQKKLEEAQKEVNEIKKQFEEMKGEKSQIGIEAASLELEVIKLSNRLDSSAKVQEKLKQLCEQKKLKLEDLQQNYNVLRLQFLRLDRKYGNLEKKLSDSTEATKKEVDLAKELQERVLRLQSDLEDALEEQAEKDSLLDQLKSLKSKEKEFILKIKQLESTIEEVSYEAQTTIDCLDPKLTREANLGFTPSNQLKDVFKKLKNIILFFMKQNDELKVKTKPNKQNKTSNLIIQQFQGGAGFYHYLITAFVMVTIFLLSEIYFQMDPSGFKGIIHFMTWIPLFLFVALLKITLS